MLRGYTALVIWCLLVIGANLACTDSKSKTYYQGQRATPANQSVRTATSPTYDYIRFATPNQRPSGLEFNPISGRWWIGFPQSSTVAEVASNGALTSLPTESGIPNSSSCLHFDPTQNRLLMASTHQSGTSLRVYAADTGRLETEVPLSTIAPGAPNYLAGDLTTDAAGNIYITDTLAGLIYRVDPNLDASIFFRDSQLLKHPSAVVCHPNGYLLVSALGNGPNDSSVVKIPLNRTKPATQVTTPADFRGFADATINRYGTVIGIGEMDSFPSLLALHSMDEWRTARIVRTQSIAPATAVATDQQDTYFLLNEPMAAEGSIQIVRW